MVHFSNEFYAPSQRANLLTGSKVRRLLCNLIVLALWLVACQAPTPSPAPVIAIRLIERQPYPFGHNEREQLLERGLTQEQIESISVEKITYLSEGLRIKAYLLQPVKDGRYPVVIYNAGDEGPSPVEMMPYAREGYVVISSWLRGHGESEGVDEFGGADLNDVLNLIPLAKTLSKADARRIAMVGVDRGGMMTYLALTRSDEIRVAAVRGARSNLMCGLDHRIVQQLGRTVREGPQAYFTRSVVNFVHLINTPVLIQHANEDQKVGVAQAYLMSGALTFYGKPHRLMVYKSGDHDLFDHRQEVFEEQMKWIANHLTSGKLGASRETHRPFFASQAFANDGEIVARSFYEFDAKERKALLRSGMKEGEIDNIHVEEITYLSEGLRIKGYLLYPKAEGRYPVLIHNRGGLGLSPFGLAFYAREGYIVVSSWLRGYGGSEGRADSLAGHVRDTLNLIPLIHNLPNADPSRIAMGGISYGGMITYLALTSTDKIKVAYAIGALSLSCEWEQQLWGRDYPGRRWDQPELYFASSPLYLAHLSQAPILIQHGTADYHVSVENALLMGVALDYYGKPYRMSIYENGNHNLSSHAWDSFQERLDWIKHYLRGR